MASAFQPAQPVADIQSWVLEGTAYAEREAEGAAAFSSSTTGRSLLSLVYAPDEFLVIKWSRQSDAGLMNEGRMLTELTTSGIGRPRVVAFKHDNRGVALATEGIFASPSFETGSAVDAAISLARSGITHGDLAPWNLLTTPPGERLLIDWEEAINGLVAYEDLAHFLVQRASLVHRSSAARWLKREPAWRWAFEKYEHESGLPQGGWREGLQSYLARSMGRPLPQHGRTFRQSALSELQA